MERKENKLEGKVESHEAYKLNTKEHTTYLENRNEQDLTHELERHREVFNHAVVVNNSGISYATEEKLEVSKDIWSDLSTINSIINSSVVTVEVQGGIQLKVATLSWIRSFFAYRKVDPEDVRNIMDKTSRYIIKTNKKKLDGEHYYTVNPNITPAKEDNKANETEDSRSVESV